VLGKQGSVLQLPTKRVVSRQLSQIIFEAQYLHHPGVDSEGNRRISFFHSGKRLTGNAGTLGHHLRREFAAQAGEFQPIAVALE
jgi:hypothetical protein